MKNSFTVILFLSFTIGFGQKKQLVKKEPVKKTVVSPNEIKPKVEDQKSNDTGFYVTAEPSQKHIDEEIDYSQIFTSVEKQATPIGGMNAYRKYILLSLKLPEVDKTMTCDVIAKFVVWDDGSIRDVSIIKENPSGLGLGQEVARLISSSKKWIPGQINDKNVKQYFAMPFKILIEGKDEESIPNDEITKEENPNISENSIASPEKHAEPIGGITKFYKDLASKIQVPDVDVAGNYKTKVKFVVNQDGSLSDFQVLEETPSKVGLGLNVIKYLQSIENWIPSEQNGKKVKMYFVLPVTLNIEPEPVIKKKD